MKTKYEKINQTRKKTLIVLAVLYGLNFTGQGINYLRLQSELNKTNKALFIGKEKWGELPYFSKRGYGHAMDSYSEAIYGLNTCHGGDRDIIYTTIKNLEKEEESLERKVQNSIRRMIAIF